MSLTDKIRGFYISCQHEIVSSVGTGIGFVTRTVKETGAGEGVCRRSSSPKARPRLWWAPPSPTYGSCWELYHQDGLEYFHDLGLTGATQAGARASVDLWVVHGE